MSADYTAVLERCPLFERIAGSDLDAMLGCLSATRRAYRKNAVIFAAGEAAISVGIVLAGGVYVEQDDYWGNRTILARLGPGELFGEAFSCAGVEVLPVSVFAAEASEVMLIDYRKIITTCPSACAFHTRLIENMLRILAQKNVALTRKMETVTQRTTRGKLLAYLSGQAKSRGGGSFEIPFNRQELADYLSVDRSAMSAELSKMQKEGLLDYQKNHFTLRQG